MWPTVFWCFVPIEIPVLIAPGKAANLRREISNSLGEAIRKTLFSHLLRD
jgi:hypothetical protein